MNELNSISASRLRTPIENISIYEPSFSDLMATVIRRENGTQAGVEALKASIERGKVLIETSRKQIERGDKTLKKGKRNA
jgi:hypothetical protein